MRLRVLEGRKAEAFVRKMEKRGPAGLGKVERKVRTIVEDVRKHGDRALRRHAEKWDGLAPRQTLRIAKVELEQAWEEAGQEFKQALKVAAQNIRQYCEWQRPQEWRRSPLPDVELGQVVRPLASAGCYVPGGRYPLPSTLLMTVIPAQVAGVKRVAVVSPRPARETLAAAFFLGVEEFYRIGGAQAVADGRKKDGGIRLQHRLPGRTN
jgi:histidinol dehydrogenase